MENATKNLGLFLQEIKYFLIIKTRRNPNCNCRFKSKRNTSKTAIPPIY